MSKQSWWFSEEFWRHVFGYVTIAGFVILVWDLLTIGRKEARPMLVSPGHEDQKNIAAGAVTS